MSKTIGETMSLSASSTILSGVFVFVAGQLFAKLAIDPYVAFKEQMGRISVLLLRSQDKITNGRADDDLIHELKESAALLMARYSALPFFLKWKYGRFRLVPPYSDIHYAIKRLNLIASLLASKDLSVAIYPIILRIGKSLGIPTTY